MTYLIKFEFPNKTEGVQHDYKNKRIKNISKAYHVCKCNVNVRANLMVENVIPIKSGIMINIDGVQKTSYM